MVSTNVEKLESLILSASEIQELTGWPDAMIEDYLNILRNIAMLAGSADESEEVQQDNSISIAKQRARTNELFRKMNDIDSSVNNKDSVRINNLIKTVEEFSQIAVSALNQVSRLGSLVNTQQKKINDLEQQVAGL